MLKTLYIWTLARYHSLSITLVERSQDLLESLRAELLHPAERIVGERDPEGLDAAVDLVDAEVGLRQILYVVGRLVELRSVILDATFVVQDQHLLLLRIRLLAQRLLLLLRQVHVGLWNRHN